MGNNTILLKETGLCELELPEWLFDMDYPGHYFRRIKSVSITIPCVTGPYTNVNCTLTLLGNEIRIKSTATDPYSKALEGDDNRFLTNFAAMQSIATSKAQNDSGLFELSFRDERYLPFEGAGVISRWRIDMPKDCNAFDFDTVSDVIINLNYTAREGGESLKGVAKTHFNDIIKGSSNVSLTRFFSARHEYPSAWHQFLHPEIAEGDQTLVLGLSKNRFPFLFHKKTITIEEVELFIKIKNKNNMDTLKLKLLDKDDKILISEESELSELLVGETNNGLLHVKASLLKEKLPSEGELAWKLSLWKQDDVGLHIRLDEGLIKDLFLICLYSVSD